MRATFTNDIPPIAAPASADAPPDALPADPYRSRCREDLLPLVPRDARTVLSVGCGRGATEAELVRRGVEVVGIELDPAAVAVARQRGVTVFEADANAYLPALARWRFDCLLYADILEHLPDPVAVLRAHVALLRPGGTVIVSVPNFRHYSVFIELFLRGHIRYTDAGILDRTHVRMTTRKMVLDWFAACNLHTVLHRRNLTRRRDMVLSACLLGLARDFLVRQVIVVGRAPVPVADGAATATSLHKS